MGEVPGQEWGEKGVWEGGELFQPPPPPRMLGSYPACFPMGEPREKRGVLRLDRVGEPGWGRQGPGRRGLSRLSPWGVKGFWQPEGLGVSLPPRETVCVHGCARVSGDHVPASVCTAGRCACPWGPTSVPTAVRGEAYGSLRSPSLGPAGAPIASWQVPGLNIWPHLPIGREPWHPC